MKNLIYTYDYPSDKSATKGNLGDYIQSLAASQYFPHVDGYIDRDHLSQLKEGIVIGNGWYQLSDEDHFIPKSSLIKFLPVSIHINNTNEAFPKVLERLADLAPIGCRDLATLDFLERNGISAYFSSCLTTTLDIKFSDPEILSGKKSRHGVYFVDLKPGYPCSLFNFCKSVLGSRRAIISREVEALKKEFATEQIYTLTHEVPLTTTHQERFFLAEKLLKAYSSAKCVITSRIHAALPCLALGTPVVLVIRKKDVKRYGGLGDFLNHIWFDENGRLERVIERNGMGEIVNNNKHIPYANKLKETCREFIENTKQ